MYKKTAGLPAPPAPMEMTEKSWRFQFWDSPLLPTAAGRQRSLRGLAAKDPGKLVGRGEAELGRELHGLLANRSLLLPLCPLSDGH